MAWLTGPGLAEPAPVFESHLDTIIESTPPQTFMRLPPEILLGTPANFDLNQLNVKVLTSGNPAITSINLMTCETGIFPCLVGSIVVEWNGSANAQRELARHQTTGYPITLDMNLTGYLLDGSKQQPAYGFSSVMWEQDNTIYTISFPAAERQNLLFMALQMARSAPLLPEWEPSLERVR
jgi:hypothetical protein